LKPNSEIFTIIPDNEGVVAYIEMEIFSGLKIIPWELHQKGNRPCIQSDKGLKIQYILPKMSFFDDALPGCGCSQKWNQAVSGPVKKLQIHFAIQICLLQVCYS
jgi:hypothetical protein